ncbi:transposase [Vescimonas sp.]|uniref:transposase n=1 Tax=Vescimonas sp. TaxID=2892404 RepID=UPI00307BF37C
MQTRKPLRLKGYDYATPGAYFVTVCTRNKNWMFGENEPLTPSDSSFVGRDPCVPPPTTTTKYNSRANTAREIVSHWIDRIPSKFPNYTVDKWVVMPNHIHLLLQLHAADAAGHMGPALQDVIRWYKTMTTNACIQAVINGKMRPFEKTVWQTSFYDEVIRDESHYLRIWQYIDDNPAHWAEDEYYI